MTIRFAFRPRDFWVGAVWLPTIRNLLILPVPCLGFWIDFRSRRDRESGLEKILSSVEFDIRLRSLSDRDLIHEAIGKTDLLNSAYASELIRRVSPDWKDWYDDEGEPLPHSGLAPFPVEGGGK